MTGGDARDGSLLSSVIGETAHCREGVVSAGKPIQDHDGNTRATAIARLATIHSNKNISKQPTPLFSLQSAHASSSSFANAATATSSTPSQIPRQTRQTLIARRNFAPFSDNRHQRLARGVACRFQWASPTTQELWTPPRTITGPFITACVRKDPALFHSFEPIERRVLLRCVVSRTRVFVSQRRPLLCRAIEVISATRDDTKLMHSRYQEIATIYRPRFRSADSPPEARATG